MTGWRTRIDADRAFNILSAIAKKRNTTFASVANQFEAILSNKIETPYDEVFNLLMEEMLEEEGPQALLDEMAVRQPQKAESITGRVVTAEDRVRDLVNHRKKKSRNAVTLVGTLVKGRIDTANRAVDKLRKVMHKNNGIGG